MSELLPFFSRLSGRISTSGRRLMLVIGDSGYRLLRYSGHTIVDSSEWPRDAEGRRQILDELRASSDCRLVVLVDSMEQTYRREEIPAASIADRRRIVARRLDVAFPSAGLKRAVRLTHDRKKKAALAHERYLFAALPDNEEIHGWIKALSSLERPVDGIGLLPLEVAAHASRLHRLLGVSGRTSSSSSWTLIVGREHTGGIRQIVLENNDLALTRLAATPPDNLGPAMLAIQLQRDIKSTLGYLARLGYQQGMPLTMLVIADEALREEFLALPPPAADVSVLVRTPGEALAMLGFRDEHLGPEQPWADPVFASLVVDSGLARPLATEGMRSRLALWRTVRAVRAAAAAVLVGLMATGAWQVRTHFGEYNEAIRLEERRLELVATLDQRKSQLEAHDIDIGLMDRVMRTRDYLGPIRHDFAISLDNIKSVLGEEVRLIELVWRRVSQSEVRRTRNRGEENELPPVEGERPLAISLLLDLTPLENLERAIEVTGEIAGRLGEKFPGYQPVIVDHAVAILPQQSLLGDIDGRSLKRTADVGMHARIVLSREGS